MTWQMAQQVAGVAPLSPAELARARQYLYGDLAWGVGSELWMLLLLAVAYYGGLSTRFEAWLRTRQVRSPAARTAAVTAVLFAAVLGALLPFDFYIGFARERAFGFERLSVAGWFGQWGLSLLLTLVAGVLVTAIAYAWMRRRRGPVWWIKLWVVVCVGVVLSVAIDPIWIAPLFNRFTPVKNQAVRTDIGRLARKAGIPNAQILEVDTSRDSTHTNAYVVGILGSERIVIYDTLLQQQTPAEIEFTVSHEIGHYVLHHLWKGIAFTLALLFGLFALLGWLYPRWARDPDPRHPAGLPLLLLLLLGALYLASPATNGFSRWVEHQADAYGLALSQKPLAAAQGFAREEHTDLIYPDPPAWVVWWFFNHPPQHERIAFALAYARTHAHQ